MGHTGIYAWGEHIRRGAQARGTKNPLPLGVGSVKKPVNLLPSAAGRGDDKWTGKKW